MDGKNLNAAAQCRFEASVDGGASWFTDEDAIVTVTKDTDE
jgi:hypothetical protein